MALKKGETSVEQNMSTSRLGNTVKSMANEEMETESKSVKRVLSEQDMLSEQKSNTNQQQAQRTTSQQQRNKQRRVKRQKQPRQKKWINNNNNNQQYNQPPPLPPHSYNNLNHYHPQSLNNLNNFNLTNLNSLSNLNPNLNQSNYPPPNLNQPPPTNFANLNALGFQGMNQNSFAPPPPNLNQTNFQNLNPLNFQNINQNLNAVQQSLPQHKRFHHFGNQYSNQSHSNAHYQHNSNNNHFNQNNRKLRKDVRKKREQWANRKQIKEGLINSTANNQNSNNNQQSSQKQQLCKRQVPAPYNTTQFLMDDHNVREPDCQAFKKLIRKETPKDGLDEVQTNDENSEQPNRRLHTYINDESSDEEFYSSPDDEQDFMEKQFTETYDNIHAERLDLMSKTELIQEYLFLESKVSVLEDQLRNQNLNLVANPYTTEQSSTTEEEQSNDNIGLESSGNNLDASAVDDHQNKMIQEETTEDFTNSSVSQLHPTANANKNSAPPDARTKISLEQLQNEIKRLMKENCKLKSENEFLKRNHYNSNNESVLESSDEQPANRLTISDEQQLNQLVQNQQLEQQEMNEADQSNDDSTDSSSSDESNDDESVTNESSRDSESKLENGHLNEESKMNGHHDANQVLLIEENANMNAVLEGEQN